MPRISWQACFITEGSKACLPYQEIVLTAGLQHDHRSRVLYELQLLPSRLRQDHNRQEREHSLSLHKPAPDTEMEQPCVWRLQGDPTSSTLLVWA